MAEKQTLARPYAEAVFELAQARSMLKPWSGMLGLIAAVAADENMQRLAGDPRVDRARFRELFLGVCGDVQGSTSVAGGRKPGATQGNPSALVGHRVVARGWLTESKGRLHLRVSHPAMLTWRN